MHACYVQHMHACYVRYDHARCYNEFVDDHDIWMNDMYYASNMWVNVIHYAGWHEDVCYAFEDMYTICLRGYLFQYYDDVILIKETPWMICK